MENTRYELLKTKILALLSSQSIPLTINQISGLLMKNRNTVNSALYGTQRHPGLVEEGLVHDLKNVKGKIAFKIYNFNLFY